MQDLKERALRLVKEHVGQVPSKISRVTTGLFNDTFIISFNEDVSIDYNREFLKINKLILRIAPRDDTGFIFYEKNMMWQEPDIHALLLAKTSVPVPRIFVADFSRELIDRDFLLMEFMQGIPLSNAKFLNKGMISNILYQVGIYLKEIHSIHFKEHGYRGKHSPCPTRDNWPDAFAIMWDYLLKDLVNCKAYTKEEARIFLDAIEDKKECFRMDSRASLLHMDIWSQNILVNNLGKVTALVDWDRSLSGDPEIEFSVLDYCGISSNSFWRGYGTNPKDDDDFKVRRLFYLLYEHQKYIIINILRKKDARLADRYKRESLSILKEIIKH
ncbi:MAG: phosphotransferase family protein [Promethearchaeota archaeon]